MRGLNVTNNNFLCLSLFSIATQMPVDKDVNFEQIARGTPVSLPILTIVSLLLFVAFHILHGDVVVMRHLSSVANFILPFLSSYLLCYCYSAAAVGLFWSGIV